MKTILRLAVLALAGTAVLAFAGNALATQKLSVKQSTTSLTIKVSQAQTDPQPLRTHLRPNGYSSTSAAPGTRSDPRPHSVLARLESRCFGESSPSRRPPPRPGATGSTSLLDLLSRSRASITCPALRPVAARKRRSSRTSSSCASHPTTFRRNGPSPNGPGSSTRFTGTTSHVPGQSIW